MSDAQTQALGEIWIDPNKRSVQVSVPSNIPTLAPGLYLVATPIGSARDITLRALDVLTAANILVAEDTRSLRRLLSIHSIGVGNRPIIAYHDHSTEDLRRRLIQSISEGKSVAYTADAGMPLIADPGFDLVQTTTAAEHLVTVVPGASASLSALVLSGLPSDSFFFGGFLPKQQAARRARLETLTNVPGTLIFFESAKRVQSTITDARGVFGGARKAAISREITKKYEEVLRGSLLQLESQLTQRTLRGELALLIDRAPASEDGDDAELIASLQTALKTLSVRDAAEVVAEAASVPRRRVYRLALDLLDRTDNS
ncbi:MAG: 16S rRNA (cytidine(1402)-2'-O)-methyltransferase [Aestuariivita sp.]|nr:16S rRNA (cytidine(1402)-2'-O)-methyltransferase [Aestuariivita sp.]MCY4346260.1 16S rRNA (cytidine(1402)-2'-O)-methyltransferase [Aestuariivita sp.]